MGWRVIQTAALVAAAVALAPSGAQAQGTVNVNTADAVELSRLPGVTLATARQIVAWRDANGPFEQAEDLLKVKRVNAALLARIKDRIGFEDQAAEAGDAGGGSLQRSNRMEFDARVVRGEAAGSGAVFLFERAPRPLPSMVARRTTWLDDTVRDVLGADWDPEAEGAKDAEPGKNAADDPGGKKPDSTRPAKRPRKKTRRTR